MSLALIMGASSGIGNAIARSFAEKGYDVITVDLDDCPSCGQIRHFKMNVLEEAKVSSLFNRLHGFGGLEVAVNCVGQYCKRDFLLELKTIDFESAFNSNFYSLLNCLQAEIAFMLKNKIQGHIINVLSIASKVGIKKGATYVASKHAALGLTRVAANEYVRRGIKINAISPGAINTPLLREKLRLEANVHKDFSKIYPVGRVGEPIDVAEVALFLAKSGGFITGQNFVIDGGLLSCLEI